MRPLRERPPALRLLILYKTVKAPAMFVVAATLTFAPHAAARVIAHLVFELAEMPRILGALGRYLREHVTTSALQTVALLGWLDALTTAVEATLLWLDKAWAEWVVIVALAALLPFELFEIFRRPTAGHFAIFLLNVAAVAYLVVRRLRDARAHHEAREAARRVSTA